MKKTSFQLSSKSPPSSSKSTGHHSAGHQSTGQQSTSASTKTSATALTDNDDDCDCVHICGQMSYDDLQHAADAVPTSGVEHYYAPAKTVSAPVQLTLHSIAQTLENVQAAMCTMDRRMGRTGRVVRRVVARLRVQGIKVQLLQKRLRVVEPKINLCFPTPQQRPPASPACRPRLIPKPCCHPPQVPQQCMNTRSVCGRCRIPCRGHSLPAIRRPCLVPCKDTGPCVPSGSTNTCAGCYKPCASCNKPCMSCNKPCACCNKTCACCAEPSPPPPPPVPAYVRCLSEDHPGDSACDNLGRQLAAMSHEGRTDDVLSLLVAGADVNFNNSSRWTPLHKAAAQAHPCVVGLLLQWGACVNVATVYGFTPLHLAAANDREGRCVTLLIEAGADLNSWNRSGQVPLHLAAETDNMEAARSLVAAGANKCALDEEGRQPAMVARSAAMRRLLRTGARGCGGRGCGARGCGNHRRAKSCVQIGMPCCCCKGCS